MIGAYAAVNDADSQCPGLPDLGQGVIMGVGAVVLYVDDIEREAALWGSMLEVERRPSEAADHCRLGKRHDAGVDADGP